MDDGAARRRATSLAGRASFTLPLLSPPGRRRTRAPRATARSSRAPSPPLPLVASGGSVAAATPRTPRRVTRRAWTRRGRRATSRRLAARRRRIRRRAACEALRGRRGREVDAPAAGGVDGDENARRAGGPRARPHRAPRAGRELTARDTVRGATMGATATADIVSARARRDRVRATKSAPWEKARKALHRPPEQRKSPSETSIEPAF